MRTLATKQPTNDSAKQKKKGNKERSSRSVSSLSTGMPLLQRKCACGGGCPRCKEDLGIQTKLKIGEPNDKYEQEADQVANQVMQTLDSKIVQYMTGSKNFSHTQPMIQRFANDEADTSTSEATELESKPAGTAESETEGETVEPETSTSMVLLVEDDAEGIESNQMRKSEFLRQLQDEVCTTVNEIIAVKNLTTDNCPYLAYWFDRYRNSDSQHLERVIHRYAPETVEATTAQDYISLCVKRAQQAAIQWLKTGEVTGIPEEVPPESLNLPEASSDQEAENVSDENQCILFKGDNSGERETTDPQRIKARLGSGRSLDSEVQSRMGAAFQQDFSQVHLHTDDRAAKLSDSLKARAFTIGQDIAFGAGEYQPGTPIGDALIAHELAHVVQQGGAKATPETVQKNSGEQQALEEEADRSAIGVVFSLWNGIKQVSGDISQNTIPRLKSGLRLQRCLLTGCKGDNSGGSTPIQPIDIPGRPSSASFLNAYQKIDYINATTAQAWATVGGNVGKSFDDGNSCATRLSYGLNYGTAPIDTPHNGSWAYKNDSRTKFKGKAGDEKIYIIRAAKMRDYLRQKFGAPDATLKTGAEAEKFQKSLAPGQAAIFAGKGHAGVIVDGYKDPYVFTDPNVLPVDAWKLSVP